ncbi:MAG: response regulator [Deltaproteobacteria bacterium]
MLESLGYHLENKNHPSDALASFQTNPDAFDLVITDTTMPDITGDRLAQELLKIRPDIPIILCTGYSSHMNEKAAREMGIKGFAMKPLSREELAKTVRRVLDA